MEMKLSGTRIKELRLKLSWSQEKLAEEAALNVRTVQRAETDGSASLRTRLQLAQALQVQPEDLDAELKSGVQTASIYYVAILLLVSVIYLASQPAWFSLSAANYSWIGLRAPGEPWQPFAAWWFVNFALWTVLCTPVLRHLYRKHQSLFAPYLAAFGIGLGVALLRTWQPSLVVDLLTSLLSIGGLALLLSLYVPRLDTRVLRHGVFMSLGTYMFIWFFQVLLYFPMGMWMRVSLHGLGKPPFPDSFLLTVVAEGVNNLLPLIPLALVLLLSLARRPSVLWCSTLSGSSAQEAVSQI